MPLGCAAAVTIDRQTLLKYDPLPEPPRRRSTNDRKHALIIILVGTPLIALEAALGLQTREMFFLYIKAVSAMGAMLTLVIAVLGFLTGGLYGIIDRLTFPLANWSTFGPTGGRFINHDDHWFWKRYAIAWLYFWMWLALPTMASIKALF